MSEKTFTVAGTSTYNGQNKPRFANDLDARLKILTKGGHTNIAMITLPTAMTKSEALAYLSANPGAYNAESIKARIEQFAAENEKVAKRDAVKNGTAPKSTKTSISSATSTPKARKVAKEKKAKIVSPVAASAAPAEVEVEQVAAEVTA